MTEPSPSPVFENYSNGVETDPKDSEKTIKLPVDLSNLKFYKLDVDAQDVGCVTPGLLANI